MTLDHKRYLIILRIKWMYIIYYNHNYKRSVSMIRISIATDKIAVTIVKQNNFSDCVVV